MADEAGLPEVHTALVNCPKSREYAVISALFAEQADATDLPISSANAPLATTRLVDDVFRSYVPGGTGLTFGKGLSPFSIVCEGHKEAADAKTLAHNASLVESGTSTSLTDVKTITSNDVRFPTEVYVAVEKLCGWSVAVDVFHGINHPVAVTICNAIRSIGPSLHRLVTQMGDNQSAGMDLVCCVMFDMQQDYFQYLNLAARVPLGGVAPPPVAPTFVGVQQRVATYRVDGLSPLPLSWYSLVSAPANPRGTPARVSPRGAAGMTATFNTNADCRLLTRFHDSEHDTISSLLEGHDPKIPKHNNKPVCLTWALKGQCNATCKRHENHVRYARGTIQVLHRLLDQCGVANQQE